MLKLKLSRALKVAARCTVLSDGVRHRVCVDRPLSSSLSGTVRAPSLLLLSFSTAHEEPARTAFMIVNCRETMESVPRQALGEEPSLELRRKKEMPILPVAHDDTPRRLVANTGGVNMMST